MGQENAPFKFKAVYLTDKEVIELEEKRKILIKEEIIYGCGSSFPKNPDFGAEKQVTHLPCFPAKFSISDMIPIKFPEVTPIRQKIYVRQLKKISSNIPTNKNGTFRTNQII